MDHRRFGNIVVLRIDRGEEITEKLKQTALQENIKLAHISALGATDDFTVGIFSLAEKQYHAYDFKGDFEIVSLTGTVNTMNGEYYSHLHMSVAGKEGKVFGGHLNRAVVSVTCEMIITVLDGTVDRKLDESIGINLFDFG